MAQSSVAGQVVTADGEPLPGATVLLEGTGHGTTTDTSGRFTLDGVTDEQQTVVISFIGFATQRLSVAELRQADGQVVQAEAEVVLDEFVLLHDGFARRSRLQSGLALTYVDPEQLQQTSDVGVIQRMSGRLPGVQITRSTGDPGAGANISIRGTNTLSGASQPLVVLDGVPISNSSIGAVFGAGVVQQSRLNDIQPEEIAHVEVLRSAGAAARWGSQAANGVIVITTKDGQGGAHPFTASYTSRLGVQYISARHPKQNRFGQGTGGAFSATSRDSWGDDISQRAGGADIQITSPGQYFSDAALSEDLYAGFFVADGGTTYYAVPGGFSYDALGNQLDQHGGKRSRTTYNDAVLDDLVGRGSMVENIITLSSQSETGSTFASASHMRHRGIIQNGSDLERVNLRLNLVQRPTSWLQFTGKAGYVGTTSDRAETGTNTNGFYLGYLRSPADFNHSDYRGRYFSSPNAAGVFSHRSFHSRYLGFGRGAIYNNPYWAVNEVQNTSDVDRLLGSFTAEVFPLEGMRIMARAGLDTYTDERLGFYPVLSAFAFSGFGNNAGQQRNETLREASYNYDLLASYELPEWGLLGIELSAGFNLNDRVLDYQRVLINGLTLAGSGPDIDNAPPSNSTPTDQYVPVRTYRFWSLAHLSVADQLFADVTVAQETGSAFGPQSEPFYYPSLSVAWHAHRSLELPEAVSFLKVRAAAGRVGVQPQPFRFSTGFVTNQSFSDGFLQVAELEWGLYGNGVYLRNAEAGDPQLRPEVKSEVEVGLDVELFGRLSFSSTFYTNTIDDLLLSVPASPASGFTQQYTNAGTMTNQGWELEASYQGALPMPSSSWGLFANWSRNVNEVQELGGAEVLILGEGEGGNVRMAAAVGRPLGSFWARDWQRTESGAAVLNDEGFPVPGEFGILASPHPEWLSGFGGHLAVHGVRLDVLMQYHHGGYFFPGTKSIMQQFGTYGTVGDYVTVPETDAGFVYNYAGEEVASGTEVRGNLADFGGGTVLLDESWYRTGEGGGLSSSTWGQFLERNHWLKIREVRLSYGLDPTLLGANNPLREINLSLSASNLLLWGSIDNLDAETSALGVGLERGQDFFNNPGASTVMFTLNLKY